MPEFNLLLVLLLYTFIFFFAFLSAAVLLAYLPTRSSDQIVVLITLASGAIWVSVLLTIVLLIPYGSVIAFIVSIYIFAFSVAITWIVYHLGRWLWIWDAMNAIRRDVRLIADSYVEQSQEAKEGVEQSVTQLKESLEQITTEDSPEVDQSRIVELETSIKLIEKSLDEYKTKLRENEDVFTEALNTLASRIPGAFQDITQKEIKQRLIYLERLMKDVEDRQEGRTALRLEKWQLFVAIVAILLPYVLAFVVTILNVMGVIDANWEVVK